MNRLKRPNEAVLPPATRPQFSHTGKRRRIDHLSKNARVRPGTVPHGLPNNPREYDLSRTPGRSSKGHAYRNAVFQALLNTPMFVNFVRMHSRRYSDSNCCPIKVTCLTCAMANLADYYWANTERAQQVNHFCEQLWNVCQKTFWPRVISTTHIGPTDLDDEFFPDTFLLHFLTEMRSQLECNPSEHQTFEKMFTVHTVRRWRCKQNAFCKWASAPYKWESSLHLNLSVQKPQAKVKQTKVLLGIQRALQVPSRLASRRGSAVTKSRCENCQGSVESIVEIDNLPEILIVIRDTEELSSEDDPDIPYSTELNLAGLTSGLDDNTDPKKFELVSGVGENRYSRATSRNYAFARGAEDVRNKWFCIMDESVVEIDFDVLEKLQRPAIDGGLASDFPPMCPEIFLYRRKDYDNRTQEIDAFGPDSPLNDLVLTRDVMSRSINDIFTQKIGRGLLKFKVKFTPADPSPKDIIEVDLKLSYELDGKHYGIKSNDNQNFLGFQLHPLDGEDQKNFNAIVSPFDGRAIDRALRRVKGIYPANQSEGLEAIRQVAIQQGLPDPTTSSTAFPQPSAETMDVDAPNKFNSSVAIGWDAQNQTQVAKATEAALDAITQAYRFQPDNGSNKNGNKEYEWNGSNNSRGRGGRWGRGLGNGRGNWNNHQNDRSNNNNNSNNRNNNRWNENSSNQNGNNNNNNNNNNNKSRNNYSNNKKRQRT